MDSNLLIERLLIISGFRWDPSNFMPMYQFFDAQPREHREQFVAMSKSMENAAFEKTIYWGIVSGWKVLLQDRCESCSIPSRLIVHHLSYEHRGEEHLHLEDLKVLCRDCHAAIHVDSEATKRAIHGEDKTMDELRREIIKTALDKRDRATTYRHYRSQYEGSVSHDGDMNDYQLVMDQTRRQNPLMSALEPTSGLLGKEYAKEAEAESDHHLHLRGTGGRGAAEGLWRISLEAVDGWTLRARPAAEDDKGPFARLLGTP